MNNQKKEREFKIYFMNKQKEIKKIVSQIAKGYKPEKVILFGSFAYGKPDKGSDVDLLVIKNTEESKKKRLLGVEKMLLDRIMPLDILVYTPKEIENRLSLGDFFIEDIVKKGKLVYAKE